VLGGVGELETILAQTRAGELIVAAPDSGELPDLARIERAASGAGVPCRLVQRRSETIVAPAPVTPE
jgi:hypothetical protein